MLDRLDETLNFHVQALRLRDQRQQVLASNIANADTPNYQARDLDFRASLQSALKGATASAGVKLAAPGPGHLNGTPGVAGAGLLYRTPSQGNVDGNTVDIDAERAAFSDNAIHYEFNLTRLNRQIQGLLAVIKG
ncbi:MAG: flagellar basal body rod protein FlgB [Pseudomonadota bacterium]